MPRPVRRDAPEKRGSKPKLEYPLGGPSADAEAINDAGVAAGWAYTPEQAPPGEPSSDHAVTFALATL